MDAQTQDRTVCPDGRHAHQVSPRGHAGRLRTQRDCKLQIAIFQILTILVLPSLFTGCMSAVRKGQTQSPAGCKECHREIVDDWQHSSHAFAWTSPEFIEQTDQHTQESCLPCHASEPLLEQHASEMPLLRDDQRHHGVHCHTCHQVGRGFAGPHRSRIGPHPTVTDNVRLTSSEFCGTCHEQEMEEYNDLYLTSLNQFQAGQTCTQCHMPARFERLTQDHLLAYIHPRRIVRDHSMPLWNEAMLADAITINEPKLRDAEVGLEVVFTLTNATAGHRIPTGKYGYRELLITAELLDADGQVLGARERSLLGGFGHGLAPNEPTEFALPVMLGDEGEPATIRIRVERVNEDRSFAALFFEKAWPKK